LIYPQAKAEGELPPAPPSEDKGHSITH
jgi:hypothetical protein